MTNGDKIRQYTDKELVRFLVDFDVISQFCPSDEIARNCNGEIDCKHCWLNDCKQCWLKWLQEEVQEDG